MQAGVDALREDSLGRLAMTRCISQPQVYQLRILIVLQIALTFFSAVHTLVGYYLIVGRSMGGI
jgi:hypothetical protein